MHLKSPLRETLRLVGELMRDAEDYWWVIASAAAALHGVDQPEVADVDVLASDRDATAVLEKLGVSPLANTPHPLFDSRILGRLTSAPMPIEIMAGFRFLGVSGWQVMAPKSREQVKLDGEALFIPSRLELAEMLTALGRPKDLQRAHLLTAH